MKTAFITLAFLCLPFFIFSQNNYNLNIYFAPSDVVIRIDKKQVIDLRGKANPFVISLSEGEHLVEAWAKEFTIHEFETTIVADGVNKLVIGLRDLSEEFKEYKIANKEYTRKKAKSNKFLILSSLTGGSGVAFLTVSGLQRKRLINELEEAKTSYASAVNENELIQATAEHDKALANLDNRTLFFGAAGVALTAGSAAIAYLWHKNRKKYKDLPAPTYENQNPFVYHSKFLEDNLTRIEFTGNGFVLTF